MIEPKLVLKTVHILGVENWATNDVMFNQANICEKKKYGNMILISQFIISNCAGRCCSEE